MNEDLKYNLKTLIKNSDDLNTIIDFGIFIFSLTNEDFNAEFPFEDNNESINEFIIKKLKDNKIS